MKVPPPTVGFVLVLLLAGIAGADDTTPDADEQVVQANDSQELATPEQIAFFETEIRPLLVDRCFECHSGNSPSLKAGLRLDSREAVLEGGDSGPAVVSGKPEESLLIESIRYQSYEMPPDEKLSDAEIASLSRWVEMGVPWPEEFGPTASAEEGYDWEELGRHWAWQPIERVEPPAAHDGERIRNPIDQFVTARLRDAGLPQPGPAPASVFVRRAFIDLIGIAPTPDELDFWTTRLGTSEGIELDDAAVRELVDNLLNRPQYGERWGRHWLDVARYSDTGGWTQDNHPHPMAWRYRDWVVEAFNADLPYDEFVRCQLAGDMIDRDAAVGTGFLALGPTYTSDGGDPESIAQARSETLDDRVDTFSRAFLGLTVACARCHDHKFDPIPTQDYYSIAGIFNNTNEGETPLVDDDVVQFYHAAQQAIRELHERINMARTSAEQESRELTAEEQTQIASWEAEVGDLEATAPSKYDFAHTIHDSGSSDMSIALRGNLLKPGEMAPRRFLRIVAGEEREAFTEGSGRSQLVDAVVDPENPLTARVMVNRIWQNHFGAALVRTPDNFGTLGEEPTHPALLDWLAIQFVESGWSIKAMHRLIMTSATYRSSSDFNDFAFAVDGDNRLLWRMTPRRMDIESWRDSLLMVTGELDTTLGGRSIENILVSNRRTLYATISRNDPLESDQFLRMFNFPIPRGSSAQRTSNIIPQQFLFMMNSPFMLERARVLAEKLLESSEDTQQRIEQAYVLLYGRNPTESERQVAIRFLELDQPSQSGLDRWQQYCQVLLSANEFMFIR